MLRQLLIGAFTLFFAATIAFAQAAPGETQPQGAGPGPGPGRPNRGMGPGMLSQEAQMMITANGVFVLHAGVLAKFDATTLQPQGAALELFGPLAAMPTLSEPPTDQERTAMQSWVKGFTMRLSPATMLAKGDELLIVQNNNFFRVNQQTMAVDTTKAGLLSQNAWAQTQLPVTQLLMTGKPVLQLVDNTLYVIIGANLVTVNADTGAVLSNGTLPQEMNPMQDMRALMSTGLLGGGNGMMGGGAGRRNGGGRRGGGANNAPPAGENAPPPPAQ